jgi:phthiocerol/phenolphthiocerol synthesis type-I polyketide synthase C
MLAVDLDVDGAKAALAGFEDTVAVAVNNGPRSCVLSGDTDSVLALKELLEADGVFCRLVNVDYASHSPQMAELSEDLLAVLDGVAPRAGRVPLMSTVRLAELAGPEMDAEYWVENLSRPVMFADALTRLFDADVTHVVEISAHPILTPAVQELAALREQAPQALSTLRRDEGSPRDLALALARGYVAGLEPFGRLPRGGPVSVPGYPWERRRYWVQERRRARGRGDLDVELTPTVGEQDVWSGALELAADSAPWLVDHKVHEAVVVPGAALMTLALRTGLARTGRGPRALSGVEFLSDLTLTDQPARLAATWREDVTEGGSFRLSSLAEGATGWTTHAVARVFHGVPEGSEPDIGFPERLMDGAVEAVDDFYTACAARGLNYGPAFQGVRRLFRDGAEALGEVVLPKSCHAGARPETLHPALWDAALQVALLLFGGDEAVVPRSVDRLTVHRVLDEPVLAAWSHAVRRGDDRIDYHLFDADRRPLVTIEGLAMQRLPETAVLDSDEQRTYRLEFMEQPVPEADVSVGSWSVAGADDEARRALLDALSRRGAQIRDSVTDEPDGVAFLAPAGDLAAQRRGLLDLTELVRAAVALPAPPRVVIVTAHGQAVGGEDLPDPGAALYWGYGRVLRREHPELRSTLIDVGAGTDDGAATAYPAPAWPDAAAAILAADDEDQLALRAGRRFAARLVRGLGEPSSTPAPWQRPETAFRLVSDRPGYWDGLAFRALHRRAPGPGEVEVAVTATALNFLDVMKAMGTYPDPRGGELFGTECAGVVVAVGPDVAEVEIGQRVVACAMPALASHLTVRRPRAADPGAPDRRRRRGAPHGARHRLVRTRRPGPDRARRNGADPLCGRRPGPGRGAGRHAPRCRRHRHRRHRGQAPVPARTGHRARLRLPRPALGRRRARRDRRPRRGRRPQLPDRGRDPAGAGPAGRLRPLRRGGEEGRLRRPYHQHGGVQEGDQRVLRGCRVPDERPPAKVRPAAGGRVGAGQRRLFRRAARDRVPGCRGT